MLRCAAQATCGLIKVAATLLQMVEEFYSCFGIIDVHDHLRQGSLAMEREWYTHKWWHRVFATIYGICLIDSYLAYKFEMEAIHNSPDDLKTYIGKLAYQLIHNNFLGQGMAMRNKDGERQ